MQTTREATLARLREAVAVRDDAEARVTELVVQARAERATWREIASAVGTAPSNTHRKYAALTDAVPE